MCSIVTCFERLVGNRWVILISNVRRDKQYTFIEGILHRFSNNCANKWPSLFTHDCLVYNGEVETSRT